MGKGPDVSQGVNTLQNFEGKLAPIALGYAKAAQPAQDYWTALLKGGVGAQNVVAPTAMAISEGAKGTENSLRNFLPMGGERNLALANLQNQKQAQIANLYANVQPLAAQQLLGITTGGGTGLGGVTANAGGSLVGLAGQQAAAKGSALGGLGMGLGTAAGGYFGGK